MKHFVFDLDGTLIDSHGVYLETLNETFQRFDVPSESIDLPLSRKMFARDFLGLYFSNTHLDEAFNHLIQRNIDLSHRIQPYEGALDILEFIKGKGLALSIWTGRERATAVDVIERTKIGQYADRLVTGSCVAQNKPHPDGMLKILRESQSDRADVLMIGDSDYDVHGAKAAQVRVASVSWGNPHSKDLAQISDHHFHAVPEFKAWAVELLKSR